MLRIFEYETDTGEWDDYIYNNDNANIYHQIAWRRIIENTFGHKSYYLIAKDNNIIKGVLPLFLMESKLFGRHLISLPFLDRAGVISDNQQIMSLLCDQAIGLAQRSQVDFLELRNQHEVNHNDLITVAHKVNFILPSDLSPDILWKNVLQKNVKNKVRKAWKNQIYVDIGNDPQFISNFYHVYCIHMRYLGTPVYPKLFFLNILKEFADSINILLAKHEDEVIGGKIVLPFKDTLYFISQYSLRQYNEFHPNNLLYWTAVEYASKNGFKFCDMGR